MLPTGGSESTFAPVAASQVAGQRGVIGTEFTMRALETPQTFAGLFGVTNPTGLAIPPIYAKWNFVVGQVGSATEKVLVTNRQVSR